MKNFLDRYDIDKSSWGDGPWQTEPNVIARIEKATGYETFIIRHKDHGALCGYVGVYRDHPAFKVYHDLDNIYVHGGLTYSALNEPIHSMKKEKPDIWWLGFDCLHFCDFSPAYPQIFGDKKEDYKTILFVQNEIINLALQLKRMENV